MTKFFSFVFLLPYVLLLCQNTNGVSDKIFKDSISYFSQNGRFFKCIRNKQNIDKCSNKVEIMPGTKEYKDWSEFFSTSIVYDKNYIYDLPYKKGQNFKIIQDYNGEFSHYQINAIDFRMAEGTEVLAARDGIVVKIIKDNKIGCPSKECSKYGNYISIIHADNTRAEYWHLMYDGVIVNVGDKIKKGDLIGFSGNTGWSSESHLHFVCYTPPYSKMKNLETAKTLFKTGDGNRVEYLYEGKVYSRNY